MTLNLIRQWGNCVAWTEELTERILHDERLPCSPSQITSRKQLEAFAEYQRDMDRTIRAGV